MARRRVERPNLEDLQRPAAAEALLHNVFVGSGSLTSQQEVARVCKVDEVDNTTLATFAVLPGKHRQNVARGRNSWLKDLFGVRLQPQGCDWRLVPEVGSEVYWKAVF